MSPRNRTTRVAAALLVLSLVGVVAALRGLDRVRDRATLQDVLYIRSPKMLKRMSLGYTGLMGNIYWTRAVQYFGTRHNQGAMDYSLLAPLLQITTELDPKLIVAYRFGASFLAPQPPRGAGAPDQAIALLAHGIRHNPDNWKLYYDLGFVYYMDLKDYPRAAEAFDHGSRVPDTHPALKILAAQAAQHAGETRTARMLWEMTYSTTKDRLIRENAIDHLRALKVDEDVIRLERILAEYRRTTGRVPAKFSELVAAGVLSGIPLDRDGNPYLLKEDARVEIDHPDNFPFVTNGLPFGYTAPPYKSRIQK